MPAAVPMDIKNSVVQYSLCGLSRRPNAIKHNVSEGSVDNFVKEWKLQHGPEGQYERLRALAVALSKTGLSVQDCAEGHRVAVIMKNIGVATDEYESFISNLWKRYSAFGLGPDILLEQINQLNFFLENNQNYIGTTPSLSQILETIKSKLDAIKDLESKKQSLEKMIRELHTQKETVEAELNWDSEFKEKLNKNEFKKEDVPKFVDAALLMKEQGYDIFEIMERFSKFEEIEDACVSVERKKVNAELRYDQLLMENRDLEIQISRNSLKLHDLSSLKALGFGLAEFRMLRDIITEVGEEIGVIGNEAVRYFFEDFRKHYYEYVRLRKIVSELKAEKAQLSAIDSTNYFTELFQNFLIQSSKGSKESNPKYKPSTEVNGGGKKVRRVDENNMTTAHGLNAEPLSDTTSENPHIFEELQEGDESMEIAYEDQIVEIERTQENPRSKSEVQFNSASLSGSKERKIKNDLVDPHDPKDSSPSRLRPPSLPKPHQLKRSTERDSISNGSTPNTEFYLESEPNDSWPSLSRLLENQATLLRNMFKDRADEITE
jgi:hypothetical protein